MKSRRGHRRSACEVNLIGGQQQEPTESSPRKKRGAGRNPRPLGWGGCQFFRKRLIVIHHKASNFYSVRIGF